MGILEESGRQEKQERANIVVRIVDARKSLSIVKIEIAEISVCVWKMEMAKRVCVCEVKIKS